MKMNAKMVERRGMTGLETAIILVAFVITAAAFSFVVLNMGFLTAQKSQTVISGGMEEASSSMLCDGEVVGHFNTANATLSDLTFYVKLSPGKEPIDMDETKLLITYSNPRQVGILYSKTVTDGTITTVSQVQGDSDGLLEVGETWKIFTDFTAVEGTAATSGLTIWGSGEGKALTDPGALTQKYETFRVIVRPITGAVLTVEKSIPAVNDAYMVLD